LEFRENAYSPLDIRKTPRDTVIHPAIVIGFTGSLKMSHDRNTIIIYPKLTIGYAVLSLTRERTTSHDNALTPKTARPPRTNGFANAESSIDGAFPGLEILPTLIIPYFNNICAIEDKVILKIIKRKSFKIYFSFFLDSST
jgi:hypothetical protein